MNLFKFIKILNIFIVSTFSFIIFSITINLANILEPSPLIYYLTLVNGVVYYFLSEKLNNKKITFIGSNIAYLIMILLYIGKIDGAIYQLVAICQSLMLLESEGGNPSRDYFKDRFKVIAATLGVCMVLMIWVDRKYDYLYSWLFLSLIIGQVIICRAARNFEFKLTPNNFVRNNAVIVMFLAFLPNSWMYNFLVDIYSYAVMIFMYGVLLILKLIAALFGKRLEEMVKNLTIHKSGISLSNSTNFVSQNQDAPIWLVQTVEATLLIIIILVVLYCMKKILRNVEVMSIPNNQFECVERQKIEKINIRSEQNKDRKRVYKGPRGKIFNIFYIIEKELYKKEKFKLHMTATQMMNTVKPHIEDIESLGKIVAAYNEAKFSSKEVSEEKAINAIENYERIKKEIKSIK